jgi:hypothetical protein
MRTGRTLIVPAVGLAAGFGIAYIDSRPTWDDTGITVAAVFLVAVILGAVRPPSFWVSGVAVGLPIPAMNVVLRSNYGSAVAIAIALVGAGAGALLGKALGLGTADRAGT